MEWKNCKIEDAPIAIIDGDRGKNYPKQGDFLNIGYCLFLNASNVTKKGFDFNNCQFISEDKDEKLRKGKLFQHDIVMTTRGTLGNVAYYHEKIGYEHIRINSGMVIFRCDRNKLLPNFFYLFICSPLFINQVNSLRSGVAQPQLPIKDIKTIKIKIPPLPIQQKIADILSKYDDLIENNRRRIELLERSARLLYKEWFVRLRFPGHEHTPIIDGIPEGWEKVRLKDIADLTMGQSPESEYYNEDRSGLPFHQGVTNFGIRFPENKVYCAKITRIANEGDILFSVRAPVGRMNISLEKIIIGRGLAAIRAKHNYQGFLYYHLKNYFFKEDMIGSGVIFASVTKAGLENVQLIKPKDSILAIFLDKTISIDEQIKILFRQNQKLKQARDILLPKLMNGEIEV
jgi:type I restriction enzyme S subunit